MEFLRKDWGIAIFVFIVVGYTITYFGIWWGLAVLLVGLTAIGWKDRYKGPFPTEKQDDPKEVDSNVYEKAEKFTKTYKGLEEMEQNNADRVMEKVRQVEKEREKKEDK